MLSLLAGRPEVVGSANGPGATATFYLPAGIALDAQGNLLVADTGNGLIRSITPAGEVSTLFGPQPGDPVSGPLALDAGGNIYFGAGGNVDELTPAGQVTPFFDQSAVALAFDGGGNLYVAHNSSTYDPQTGADDGSVVQLAPGGAVLQTFPASGSYPGVSGVAADTAGNVYVGTSQQVLRILPGAPLVLSSGIDDGPGDMAVDGAGNLFVAVGVYGVVRLAADGSAVPVVPQGAVLPSDQPLLVNNIALGPGGVLYMADELNGVILRTTLP
jgi:hypothetical protein